MRKKEFGLRAEERGIVLLVGDLFGHSHAYQPWVSRAYLAGRYRTTGIWMFAVHQPDYCLVGTYPVYS